MISTTVDRGLRTWHASDAPVSAIATGTSLREGSENLCFHTCDTDALSCDTRILSCCEKHGTHFIAWDERASVVGVGLSTDRS